MQESNNGARQNNVGNVLKYAQLSASELKITNSSISSNTTKKIFREFCTYVANFQPFSDDMLPLVPQLLTF